MKPQKSLPFLHLRTVTEYDGQPLTMFVAGQSAGKGHAGDWLVHWLDGGPLAKSTKPKVWLAIPISPERWKVLKDDKMSLLQTILDPEWPMFKLVGEHPLTGSAKVFPILKLHKKYLPTAHITLSGRELKRVP